MQDTPSGVSGQFGSPGSNEEWPLVSVIMPIRNESAFIDRSLGAILAQDYPANRMEVVVIDGMSDDDTREKIASLAAESDYEVRIVDNVQRIIPTALNIGVQSARGEIIVRMDGHAVVGPDYVRQAVEGLARTGAHCVGSLQIPDPDDGYFAHAIATSNASPFGVGDSVHHYGDQEHKSTLAYLGSYPKWVMQHIGGYSEEMRAAEDCEMAYRLGKAGGSIWQIPSLKVLYVPRRSLRKLAQQYFRFGWWKVRVYQKHPMRVKMTHTIPLLFLFAVVIGPFISSVRLLWAAMLGVYLTAATVFAVKANREGWSQIPGIVLAFLTMHLSYGAGMLAGAIRYARRWKGGEVSVDPIAPIKPENDRDGADGDNRETATAQ